MKFTHGQASQSGWGDVKIWAYNHKEDFNFISLAYLEIGEKGHGKTKSTISDRAYYILGGSGTFTINNKLFSAREGDMIIVAREMPYDFCAKEGGVMRLLLFSAPAYDPTGEVRIC